MKGWSGYQSSPAKQTDTTWADGTKKSKRQMEEQKNPSRRILVQNKR